MGAKEGNAVVIDAQFGLTRVYQHPRLWDKCAKIGFEHGAHEGDLIVKAAAYAYALEGAAGARPFTVTESPT